MELDSSLLLTSVAWRCNALFQLVECTEAEQAQRTELMKCNPLRYCINHPMINDALVVVILLSRYAIILNNGEAPVDQPIPGR